MINLFSTEQVSKYHPDKYADQISDAIVTECLRRDKSAHVACETMVKDTTIVLAGEISCTGLYPPQSEDFERCARKVAEKLNYKVDNVINLIGCQSQEINKAVTEPQFIGAGDQGMMYGYAVRGKDYLPYGFYIANQLIKAIEDEVEEGLFKGDAKVQITTQEDGSNGWVKPIDTILISACHRENIDVEEIRQVLTGIVANVVDGKTLATAKLILNPSGSWTIGGPIADCGLTGRKIVCDQYGGYSPVGGGAFSGKDPTKVDRSAAYMARKIAVDIINEFPVDKASIQLAYAIGIPEPVSIKVETDGGQTIDRYILQWVKENYNLTPAGIIDYLGLYHLDYEQIAEGCHMVHFQ